MRQMGRVKQLLQGRLHGLFVAQVETMHQKHFGESLVSMWLEEMEEAGSVQVEGGEQALGECLVYTHLLCWDKCSILVHRDEG